MKRQFLGKYIYNAIKLVIIVTPFFVFIWLGVQYFSVFGDLKIETNFKKESSFISEWVPRGRALAREENLQTGEAYQRIVGEPSYLYVDVPRSYDTVDVTIDYENEDDQFIELGLATSTDPWSVRLQSFDNYIIDQAVAKGWEAIVSDAGVTMLQKERKYESLEQLQSAYPADVDVATYNYDLTVFYQDGEYQAQDGELIINQYLRGSHTFATYIKDEDLDIEFTFADINAEFNQDPITIEVSYLGGLHHQEKIPDDGIETAVARATESRKAHVVLPDLLEGLYQIAFKTTDDVVIQEIKTRQHQLVVQDHIFIVGSQEYQQFFPEAQTKTVDLYMSGKGLLAKTDHESGVQPLVVDGSILELNQVHTPFYWTANQNSCVTSNNLSSLRTITASVNDLYLETSGYFALNEQNAFDYDRNIEEITELTNFDELEIIVYQNYQPPIELSRFDQQTTTFSLEGVAGDRKNLTFLLSAPGIARNNNEIKIYRMEFVFHRDPLLQRILSRFKF